MAPQHPRSVSAAAATGMSGQADFTEARYQVLLDAAAARFRFRLFGEELAAQGDALWRHDIDMSPQRALALARLEAARGLRASYFVLLGSPFYNPFEAPCLRALTGIRDLGHQIGLHFDGGAAADPARDLECQAAVLGDLLGCPVGVFSLHNPTTYAVPALEAERSCGMVNASAPVWRARATYCSDSNGIWRFRPLAEVVADPATRNLYALTHPEWWPPEPLPPRARVDRCIDGRARACAAGYDRLLADHGRPNVTRVEP